MLLNGIKHTLPTTYALVREIASFQCTDINATTLARKMMFKSSEINQLDLLEKHSRERIALDYHRACN